MLNVEDMGVGGIDVGSGEVGYAGDEHWDEGGEDCCEKTRLISSRASPMSACRARNFANVVAGIVGRSAVMRTVAPTGGRSTGRKEEKDGIAIQTGYSV